MSSDNTHFSKILPTWIDVVSEMWQSHSPAFQSWETREKKKKGETALNGSPLHCARD